MARTLARMEGFMSVGQALRSGPSLKRKRRGADLRLRFRLGPKRRTHRGLERLLGADVIAARQSHINTRRVGRQALLMRQGTNVAGDAGKALRRVVDDTGPTE